jgi:ADP-dependent NAD(P)H-hydrate dehydratase / NAD(P)H-hydrate epimerase
MKIFRSNQIRGIDNYTIEHEPVSSLDLMERASSKLFEWFSRNLERSRRILIFIGPGNNGADGLVLARLLIRNDYKPELYYIHFTEKTTEEWKINFGRVSGYKELKFIDLIRTDQFPIVSSDDIIVDAIFGSGLKRPLDELPALIVNKINSTDCIVVSVDMPSGLLGEDNSGNTDKNIIKADYTLSFQVPKLSFLFPENYTYTGKWEILPIGLHPVALRETSTPFYFLEKKEISPLLLKRSKFAHKGNFGHGLLVAGSNGKMGAAILSAKAALRTGIGLITCHIPYSGNNIVQTALPEAMVQNDKSELIITEIINYEVFNAVAIGPGIGTGQATQEAFKRFLSQYHGPVVIDADAINILAINKEWIKYLKENTILTPHIKEFERLTGPSANSFERLKLQIEFSVRHKCIVVLKGAHTSISMTDGRVFFNSTGNPGMATAGSGDVLTGILISLIAQGYSTENASLIGVYLHGLSGDIASGKSCCESVIASDIVDNIGMAFNVIRESDENTRNQ